MISQYIQIVIVFITLLFSTAIYAATWSIKGQVLEKGTRKPLSGAYIVVRENETLSASSDERGRFELTLPEEGRYTLTAATLGGATPISIPLELKAGTPAPSPIFYLPSATLLDEVVVRAERSPDRISKSVMTGTEMRRVAGSSGDPLKSLQSLPGIASTNSSAPAVRGSGPGDNLYYVDSLPVSKIFHTGGISVFNADLIQDFNLYSAAFSPRYGDVTGAVIDVALRDPRTDRLGGKLNVNLIGADFLVEGPTAENQSAYFAARRSYFDLFIKQVDQRGVTLQIPVYSDYQGKYVWKLNETDRLTFHLNGASDAVKLSISSSSDTAKQQPILSGDLNFSDSYAMQAAVLDTTLESRTQNKLAIEHVSSEFKALIAAAGNLVLAQDINQVREFARIPFADHHELALEANFSQVKTTVNADFIKTTCTQFSAGCDLSSASKQQLVDTFNNNAWELSAQDRAKITPTLTLIGGVHHSGEDYLGKSYTEPRIGAEWDWDERTLLTAGWGKHNQLPTGQQISRKFGNPNLEHLLAEHSVVGITKKLDNDWTWKAETYYKKFTNLVLGDSTLNYINGGSGNAYGAELLIKKDGLSNLTGWLAISLARSHRQNDVTGEAFRFQYDQPINTTLVTNYKLNDDWTLGTKWNYHSGTPYTPVIGSKYEDSRYKPIYAAVNSGTLPDYHRLDIRFDRTYVYNTWKLNVYYEFNNVYFRKNLSGYRYDSTYTQKEDVYPLVIPFTFGVQGEF